MSSDFSFPFLEKDTFCERTLIGLDVRSINAERMSELSDSNEIKSDAVGDIDKEKSIKSKQCNKFSIENILGLNDNVKVNRLELMDLCQKGKVDPYHPPSLMMDHKFFISRLKTESYSSI